MFQIPEGTFGTEEEPDRVLVLVVFQIPEGTFGTVSLAFSRILHALVSNPGRNVWDSEEAFEAADYATFQIPEGTFGTGLWPPAASWGLVVSNPGRNVWDRMGWPGYIPEIMRFKSRKERLGQTSCALARGRSNAVSNPGRNVWDEGS